MLLLGSMVLFVEPNFNNRVIGHQIWLTIAEAAIPVHRPIMVVIMEICGCNAIDVEVTRAGTASKSSCSSPHILSMHTGYPPRVGATYSLPLLGPMSASLTAISSGLILLLRTDKGSTLIPQHTQL